MQALMIFVVYNDTKISWSNDLKQKLKRGTVGQFATEKVRQSLYRPFTVSNLYFDRLMNNSVHLFPKFFPHLIQRGKIG